MPDLRRGLKCQIARRAGDRPTGPNVSEFTATSGWSTIQPEPAIWLLAVYDIVGFVKAIFTALGRKNCVERRRCGEAGVKGAFFAFISTLDTGLPTSTIGLG